MLENSLGLLSMTVQKFCLLKVALAYLRVTPGKKVCFALGKYSLRVLYLCTYSNNAILGAYLKENVKVSTQLVSFI